VGYQNVFAPIRRYAEAGGHCLGLSASFGRAESDQWMREFCGEYVRVECELGRENLSLFVVPIEEEYWRWLLLVSFLRDLQAPESTLIYCSSREECDELAAWLAAAGFPAASYHAGLPASVRRERSRAFRAGHLRIVCATSAFGMGIDYPHVGRVFHFSTPYDLESYWQEVGRAGRSGQEAVCVAVWRRSDVARARHMDAEQSARYLALWKAWLSGTCRKQAIAQRLGLAGAPCGKCDRCRQGGRLPSSIIRDWEILLRDQIWWTDPAAEPLRWLEKNFARGKGLDDQPNPDSVSKSKMPRDA
jgi:superfamily II DNA helicase RecQ